MNPATLVKTQVLIEKKTAFNPKTILAKHPKDYRHQNLANKGKIDQES